MYKVSNLHIFQLLHDPLLELCALIIGQEHVDSRVDPVTCGQKKWYRANRYRSVRSIRWQRARSEEFLGVIKGLTVLDDKEARVGGLDKFQSPMPKSPKSTTEKTRLQRVSRIFRRQQPASYWIHIYCTHFWGDMYFSSYRLHPTCCLDKMPRSRFSAVTVRRESKIKP